MQVYYVYRLTCHHPETVKRYYIGFRSCRGNPVTDPYWSSSKPVKEAIARFGPEAFTKKIIAVYPTKKQALALEVKLHARLDVKNHPLFFNQSNQTSTKFTTSGSPSEATKAKMVASHARRRASQSASQSTPEQSPPECGALRGSKKLPRRESYIYIYTERSIRRGLRRPPGPRHGPDRADHRHEHRADDRPIGARRALLRRG